MVYIYLLRMKNMLKRIAPMLMYMRTIFPELIIFYLHHSFNYFDVFIDYHKEEHPIYRIIAIH